jgi:serine/threonine-protein kinase RsbW
VAIRSDQAEARRTQDLIEKQLRSHAFDEREIFCIKLALEEALVNAIKHGNQSDPKKLVHIRFQVDSERFHVRIVDEGKGFNPEDVPNPIEPENLERPCGRGLLLMRHYMSEVTYHPPGNGLSMTKLRTAGGAGAQSQAQSHGAHANGSQLNGKQVHARCGPASGPE